MSMTLPERYAANLKNQSNRTQAETHYWSEQWRLLAKDAIEAHLTQPAQSVNMKKVREVIAELRAWNNVYPGVAGYEIWADKLTTALWEKGNA